MSQHDDTTVRLTCLQLACQIEVGPNAYTPEAIQNARRFYLFLSGRDPVVDGIGVINLVDEDGEVVGDKTTAEIILLDEARQEIPTTGPLLDE